MLVAQIQISMQKDDSERVKTGFRIWLEHRNEVFMAPGKARLLELILKEGSLSKAAKSMNMSYRKAWYSIKQLNDNSPEPIVILNRGGSQGGSAELTPYGEKVIEEYNALCRSCSEFLSEKLKNMSI